MAASRFSPLVPRIEFVRGGWDGGVVIRSRFVAGVLCLALLPLALLSASTVSAATTYSAVVTIATTQVVQGCSHYSVRPHRNIVAGCADGTVYFSGMRWPHWRDYLARGRGYMWVNDCTPSCAYGQMHRYPVRVTLRHAWVQSHHRVFHRANSIFTGHKPAHPRYLRHLSLPARPLQ